MKKFILAKIHNYPLLQPYFKEIKQYFGGQKNTFFLRHIPPGTKFRQSVWLACLAIPYGRTISYGQLAAEINCRSAQAVGSALKNNPLPIIIPCHRIIKSNGEYSEYALGKDIKRWLIDYEKRVLLLQNSINL